MKPHICPVEGFIWIQFRCNWCNQDGYNPLTGDQNHFLNYIDQTFAADTTEDLAA